jgi:hypothetical protein
MTFSEHKTTTDMRGMYNKFLSLMGMMQALDIEPAAAKKAGVKIVKPRFVAGDHFYKQLSIKRVNGKWRVKR